MNDNDRLAVGVDAGGTSTVAAVSRGGVFRTERRGGPANPSSLGAAQAAASIVATVRDATDGAAPVACGTFAGRPRSVS